MNSFQKLISIFAVAAVAVVAIGATFVLAQEDAPTSPPPVESGLVEGEDGSIRQQRRTPLFTPEEMDEALATELGITVSALTDAREAARETMLQQAVTDSRITQEQADLILSGEMNLRAFLRELMQEYFSRETIKEVTAEALGLTIEEFEAAQTEGKKLPEIAEEQGVELSQIEEAVRTAFEDAIQQAVDDGRLTQEQAEQILSHERQPGKFIRDRGFGGRNGRPGRSPNLPGNTAPFSNQQP